MVQPNDPQRPNRLARSASLRDQLVGDMRQQLVETEERAQKVDDALQGVAASTEATGAALGELNTTAHAKKEKTATAAPSRRRKGE